MHTIDEIMARLSAIATECETATGDALTALEEEQRTLGEELDRLQSEATRRQALRDAVAAGRIGTAAPAAAPAVPAVSDEARIAAEERSFADYVMGRAAAIRSGEQNVTLSGNGAVIPASIAARIVKAVKDRCPILAGATVYSVKGTLKVPVWGKANSTHDIAVGYQSEFSEITADAGKFTSVDLGGFLVGALTLVGRSVENNSAFSVVEFIVNQMAEEIAVYLDGQALVGTGSNAMQGALNTTTNVTAASASAIAADELIELQSKIKQAYQVAACWTMAPATFTAIRKLKDSNNRYLLQDDVTGEFPYRLLGKPVYLSDNMPAIASGAKTILYGDYSGLSVNWRENISIEVLREKYATQHAIGVVAWMEIDSRVTDNAKLATLTMG